MKDEESRSEGIEVDHAGRRLGRDCDGSDFPLCTPLDLYKKHASQYEENLLHPPSPSLVWSLPSIHGCHLGQRPFYPSLRLYPSWPCHILLSSTEGKYLDRVRTTANRILLGFQHPYRWFRPLLPLVPQRSEVHFSRKRDPRRRTPQGESPPALIMSAQRI